MKTKINRQAFNEQTPHRNINRGPAIAQVFRGLTLLLFSAFLFIAAASKGRADVFNQNQRLVGGTSPAIVPWDWNIQGGLAVPNPTAVGTVVHIVYGIGVPTGHPNPVSVAITLPSGFTQTGMRCLKFSGPTNPPGAGVAFTPSGTLANLPIGALSVANDKVIVIFDGFFSQAGAYSAGFNPSGGALQTGTETKTLNMSAAILNLPVDLGITKQVKPQGSGSFGPTATIPIYSAPGTLTYKVTVKNLSAPDPLYHSTDVYLGQLLRLDDLLKAGNNDIHLFVTAKNFQCASFLGATCPGMPAPSGPHFLPNSGLKNLPMITYPNTSSGFIPAGGSFEITFDAEISTNSLCSSPGVSNKLENSASFTYSNGTTTISDSNPANNTSAVTTATLTVPGLPATCPTGLGIVVTKTAIPGSWTAPFTYTITIKNTNNVPLSGLALTDFVGGNGTPPFTATPSNVTCAPACLGSPATFTPSVASGSSAVLLTANFAPLAPNAVQTVQYKAQYAAPCASASTAGAIWNYASVSGPASGAGFVSNAMPVLPLCPLQVTKTQIPALAPFAAFPATLTYQVQFKNTSPTQPVTVRTIIDAMSVDSASYGKVPIDYSYGCTPNGVTGIPSSLLNFTSPSSPQPEIQFNNPVWAGLRLIDISSAAGYSFSPGGTLTCTVNVKLKQPPTNDSLCQGAGTPNFVNSAFMDTGYPYNTNQTQPAFFQKVIRPLPKCVSILVGKTVSPNAVAGGPVTFTLTVKNNGNDPTPAGIRLLDTLPGGFTLTNWNCVPSSACSPSSGTINPITVHLNPIAAGAITTVLVHATAPNVPGAYCNTDNATFNPFPPLTFFEGNQATLTTASACVQVNPAPPAPPKVTKVFSPATINIGQPVNVIFTITNPPGQGPKTGLTFSDALPNPPFTTSTLVSNTCGGTALANGHILSLINGALPAAPASGPASTCTVVFKMAPPNKCGVFHNNKGNIHESKNLDFTEMNARLTVNCVEVPGEITKVAAGVPANYAGQFKFNVVCTPPGGTPVTSIKTVSVTASDPLTPYKRGFQAKVKSTSMGSFPFGTTCTVTEVLPQPPPPPNCSWLPPSYSPPGGTVTAIGLGSMKVTVLDRLSCAEPVSGEITKVAAGVPANYAGQFRFNVVCTPPGGAPVTSIKTISVAASDPLTPYKAGLKAKVKSTSMGSFPPGTACTVTEMMPQPPPPANCSWLQPVYGPPNGMATLTAPGPVKVTVLDQLSCLTKPNPGNLTTKPIGELVPEFTTPTPTPPPPKEASPKPLPTTGPKSALVKPGFESQVPTATPTRGGPDTRKAPPSPTPEVAR